MKKNEEQEKVSRYRNVNLRQFDPIIKQYWQDFDDVLAEYNHPLSGLSVPTHDIRTVGLIKKLKKIDTWKSNLFILYLHYKKTSILAEMLNVKKTSLSVYLSEIKKELK